MTHGRQPVLDCAVAAAARLGESYFADGALRKAAQYHYPSPADPALRLAAADVDVDTALAAAASAARAFPDWAATPAIQRAGIVRELSAYLRRRRVELAELIVLESAKPISHARAEIDFCLNVMDTLCASVGELSSAARLDYLTGRRVATYLRPVGPSLLVTPWNFPLNLGVRKLATAMLAGCTFLWKPADRTPLSAMFVAEGFGDVGVPRGVAAVLPTSHSAEVVTALLRSGVVRKLSFTGSTGVGRALMGEAAHEFMRTSFELGGNGPAVVGLQADLSTAVSHVMRAKFVNSGQVCTTVNRVYVPADAVPRTIGLLGRAMDELVVGPSWHEETVVGPVISVESATRLEELLRAAASEGATVSRHGTPKPDQPNYVQPALVSGLDTQSAIARTELFGPVVNVIGYRDIDDAIAQANDTPYGLSAYAFSDDVSELNALILGLRAGMIAVNSSAPSSVSTPFGGVGWSGTGRENGVRGMTEFLDEITHVY